MSETDKRVIKTKKAIRTAFASLLVEKDINSITIKEISERADINRKTFYNYYSDLYKLIDDIEKNMLKEFQDAIKNVEFWHLRVKPIELFEALNTVISKDMEFYSYLIQSSNHTNLQDKFAEALYDSLYSKVNIYNFDPSKVSMVVSFASFGIVAIYNEWFKKKDCSLDELASNATAILFNGAVNFLDHNKKETL